MLTYEIDPTGRMDAMRRRLLKRFLEGIQKFLIVLAAHQTVSLFPGCCFSVKRRESECHSTTERLSGSKNDI